MSIYLELDTKVYLSFVFCVAQSASQIRVIHHLACKIQVGVVLLFACVFFKALVIQSKAVIQKLKK